MKGYPSVHMDVRSSDEVVRGFQGMSAATRIDLLVRLLHQCLPLEVRFLGTVLQETALQSYEAMSTMESQVNRLNSYGDLGSIHDNPKRVCLSLALLRNENNTVATLLSRLLCAEGVVAGCCNTCSIEQFEEYRLMYVMALHHPAFCFRDKEPRLRSCLAELERALEERMAAQAGAATAEAIVHGPHVLPMPSSQAQLQQCEVTGLYKRNSDKRFVYSINVVWTDSTEYTIYRPYGEFFKFQSKLLDLFPDEAGGRNKKERVIPFLPGKRFPFSSHTSKERAEKRFPEIIKYVRDLMSLPEHITSHSHIMDFFTPLPQDHFLQDTLFEKIRTLADVQDGDPSLELRRSFTLTHYSPPLHHAKDKSKTLPHKPAVGDPPNTSPTSAPVGSSPPRKAQGSTAAMSSPLYMKELEGKPQETKLSSIKESPLVLSTQQKGRELASLGAPPPRGPHDNTGTLLVGDPPVDQGSDATPYSTPVGSPSTMRGSATGAIATSAASTPGMNTKPPISDDAQSMVSSVTESPAPSPSCSPDMTKRSESCLAISVAEGQFSEETFLHWLKSHRLHKYAAVFRGMTLEQICLLKMEDLLRKGFTLGAAKKFMKQIQEWQSHLSPTSLQCLISRHPSTFSLPSYIVERDNMPPGVLRSSSSQSLQHSAMPHHQRTTSVTSIQSSLCDGPETSLSEAPVPRAAEGRGGLAARGLTAVVVGSNVTSAPPREEQVAATQDDSLAASSRGVVTSPPPPEGMLPAANPVYFYPEVPAAYGYPDVVYPSMPGKPFPPQIGNGIGSLSVSMKGKQEGLPPPGVPQQLPPLTAPLGYAYSMLPQPVPVSHYTGGGGMPPSQLVPITQMPNGFVGPHPHLVPSQQPLLPQQFSRQPQMVPYNAIPLPTCYRCGQCGHLGHECTAQGMDSFGAPFYRILEQQPRSPDHARPSQSHNET